MGLIRSRAKLYLDIFISDVISLHGNVSCKYLNLTLLRGQLWFRFLRMKDYL